MAYDFPLSREIISRLDEWIERLAEPLKPARKVPEPDGDYHWEFNEETPRVLLVAKSVRMASGIKASLCLSDSGFTVEAVSLLRLVSDFAQEVSALCAGMLQGGLPGPQEKFVTQFFSPLPRTAEEYEERERERYVTREELYKAQYRLAAAAGQDPDLLRRMTRFLNFGYDKYVHGAYRTAMELYRGDTHTFCLNGISSERRIESAETAIAGKLHEVLSALEFSAMTQGMEDLEEEVGQAREELEASRKQG